MWSPDVQFNPGPLPSFTWDEPALARELDTKNRAKTDAAFGEPPAGAVDCQFLADVRTAIRQVAIAARTELKSYYKTVVEDAGPPSDPATDMRNERDKALADMYQECLSGVGSSHGLKRTVQEVRVEHREFTVDHGLVGKPAKDRDRRAFWVILVCAFLELLVNAWTLGTAHRVH